MKNGWTNKIKELADTINGLEAEKAELGHEVRYLKGLVILKDNLISGYEVQMELTHKIIKDQGR